jgi:hypothetical protein
MGFTDEDAAKPKQPHKDGIACVSCGAKTASQWRGLNGDHCSIGKCKRAAAAQRRAAREGAKDARIEELEERLEEAEAAIELLQEQFRHFVDAGYHGRITEVEEDQSGLRLQVARLAQRVAAADTVAPAAAGGKRKPAPAGVPLPRAHLPAATA